LSLIAFYQRVEELLSAGESFVVATIVDTTGSVPQVSGARMIVTASGRNFGTVGGGKVENRALEESENLLRELLENSSLSKTRFFNWNLEKDIGMTCGGSIRIYLEAHNLAHWQITIFGAGHCATALIGLLSRLDCKITCIDTRPEWLERMPDSGRLKKILVKNYLDGLEHVPRHSFVLLLTMGHSSDSPLLLEILRGYQSGLAPYPYLGVIGSKAKAVRLHQDIAAAGLPAQFNQAFLCPVGLPLGSNEPPEIAVSIAAQLLQCRDKLGLTEAV